MMCLGQILAHIHKRFQRRKSLKTKSLHLNEILQSNEIKCFVMNTLIYRTDYVPASGSLLVTDIGLCKLSKKNLV